jgi:hypothetical protein
MSSVAQYKIEQKLISFSDNPQDLARIKEEMRNGWYFVSLTRNGSIYIGIMENRNNSTLPEDSIFIPARKKIKIIASSE